MSWQGILHIDTQKLNAESNQPPVNWGWGGSKEEK